MRRSRRSYTVLSLNYWLGYTNSKKLSCRIRLKACNFNHKDPASQEASTTAA